MVQITKIFPLLLSKRVKGTPGGLKSSITPCLKRSRFLTSVPVVPLNLFKNMYRFKGVKCVRLKDSRLLEHVRIVSYRSPVVTLIADTCSLSPPAVTHSKKLVSNQKKGRHKNDRGL